MIRKIVEIHQEKCNGCGLCADACHEGAIAMVNGKAKLIKDDYCDGLGDCLPACPTGAIKIIEREAAAYDEAAVKARMAKKNKKLSQNPSMPSGHIGCPGSRAKTLLQKEPIGADRQEIPSSLLQWPVQIQLVPVRAPYFDGADLLIAADCTAYAYANIHQDYMKNRVTLIGCPKLDAVTYAEKLSEIFRENDLKSVTVLRMEVPCCGGLTHAVQQALQNCEKEIPYQEVIFSIRGAVIE